MGERSSKKCIVRNYDMTEEMKESALKKAAEALHKFNSYSEIAQYIKMEFDKTYSPTWHCIVGRTFGTAVKHESKHYIFCNIGQTHILLFKS